jgi:uncharacterized coiled-coil protein SlyX
MAQVEELEARIAAAFQRIAAGVAALSAAPADQMAAGEPDVGEAAELAEELAAERERGEELADRLRRLAEERGAEEASAQAEIDRLNRALDAQGLDVQRLTASLAQLREDLRRLREGAEQGVADPTMINRAMLAELEALRRARAAEANEMADILSSLGSVLEAEEARANA